METLKNGIGPGHKVYKVVLTGGPCGGKTTTQARMSTFFENIGWKVFRVPETATILLGGGVKFAELDGEQVNIFQENLLKTMMQLEKTYFDLAERCHKNCLVICDRGTMDPSAYCEPEHWQKMLDKNGWRTMDLREGRYDQVVHLLSSACGAEAFYTLANNNARSEGLQLARDLDKKTQQVWVGHPYFDVIDNTMEFDAKVHKAIRVVCNKIGIQVGDRLAPDSIKLKFLIKKMPSDRVFPPFEDFDVVHNYLLVANPEKGTQARLRKRGQNGRYMYMHTVRRPMIDGQVVEVRKSLNRRDYELLLSQRDPMRQSMYKHRRCFIWKDQYYQLDVYTEPCPERCKGLILLETYSTKSTRELHLPEFLNIEKDVTDDKAYSMYNLSLREKDD